MRPFAFAAVAALALSGCSPSTSSAPSGTAPSSDAPQGTPAPTPQTPGTTLQLPPAGSLYLGVLPAGTTEPDSDISPSNLDGFESTVGRTAAYVYFTNNWFQSKAFPAHTAGWIRDRGAVPFIRLAMRSQKQTTVFDPTYTLDNIVAGQFDGDLAAWADGAKAFGTPLVVEYGSEINGDWFPWSAPYNGGLGVAPEKFRKAYRHIVELMRGRGATNITWALHYYSENYPQDPRNVPSAYYPGDDVVDWVGFSAYGSERPYDHRCPTFAALVDGMLTQLKAATTTKPFFVFEMGITQGNPGCDNGTWVRDALSNLLGGRWPELHGFAWWNEHWQNDADPSRDTIMTVQEAPATGAAFHEALTGPDALHVADRPVLK